MSQYQAVFWNYLAIRAWLAALVGVAVGTVLFWISDCIKSHSMTVPGVASRRLFSVKRMAAVVLIFAGAIIVAFLPGVSAFLEKRALYDTAPPEAAYTPPAGMTFLIMSNELATPHIKYSPEDVDAIHLEPYPRHDRFELLQNTNTIGHQ